MEELQTKELYKLFRETPRDSELYQDVLKELVRRKEGNLNGINKRN